MMLTRTRREVEVRTSRRRSRQGQMHQAQGTRDEQAASDGAGSCEGIIQAPQLETQEGLEVASTPGCCKLAVCSFVCSSPEYYDGFSEAVKKAWNRVEASLENRTPVQSIPHCLPRDKAVVDRIPGSGRRQKRVAKGDVALRLQKRRIGSESVKISMYG
ncbi:hypothetical protein LIA77_02705 [Sarocladium implicatum]|nr:hypothetical protein LIA77_02705 [Sarocladium implicatum]